MEGLEVPADRRHRRLARLVVRLVRVVRVRVESRAVGVQKLERLLDRRYKVVSHGHGQVRLDDDAEHGRRRVRVVEEVVRLLGDRVPAWNATGESSRLGDGVEASGRPRRSSAKAPWSARPHSLHVHLVAADVPVLLRDGVLEVDVVVPANEPVASMARS